MRRDLGNEIIVAIAAIGMLAVAIAFAIILSLSRNAENAATPTVPTGTSIAANTAVQTIVPSAPQNEDTATATKPTATSTPSPKNTATAIATIEPSATSRHVSKPSQTATPVKPEATQAITVSPTKRTTPPPTTVPTDKLTETLVATAVAQLASRTPNPSATQTSSPVPPTLTFTATIRPSVTPQSATNTPQPSATFTASSTPQPPMASTPTSDGPAVEGCTDSGVQISNLTAGQKLKGIVTLIGTAYNQNLLYYKIETRPDFSQFYTLYNRYETVVIQNELGSIDTSIFSPGMYWIKLTVVNKDNTLAPACAIPVIFQR